MAAVASTEAALRVKTFELENARASLIGRGNGFEAQVLDGLAEGAPVTALAGG